MSQERDDTYANPSANGVPAPVAPAGLAEIDATSPARRSPQVRAAQLARTRRPDLLRRQPATTP